MPQIDSDIQVDQELMVRLRRQLHMYPELGWDLPRTVSLVREQLSAIGIPHQVDAYGKNTVVATINPHLKGFTIGIRGDMDALPIQEANEDKPYRSRIPGRMHACGHDAHTAMLIGAAKALWGLRDRLRCRVKLLFQPCEEDRPSGAATMCRHGVMEDIDCIIMCHVNCLDDTHVLSSRAGVTNAASSRFSITLRGKAVHIAAPHMGIDALAAGVKVYTALQFLVSQGVSPFDTCVIGVGKFKAGTTTAQIPEGCTLSGSIRCLREELLLELRERVKGIVDSICTQTGCTGRVRYPRDYLPPVVNDPLLYRMFLQSAHKVVPGEYVRELEPTPGGEDFAYYQKEKPGLLFGLGMRNEEKGFVHLAHSPHWDIDEAGLATGARTMVQFVLDHMDGFLKEPS